VGFRDVFETGIGFFAEDFGFVGIYGDDAVAGGLHVLRDAETGAPGIRGEADYRDGFIVFEDVGDCVITVRPIIGDGYFHGDGLLFACAKIIEGVYWDWGRKTCEDFSFCVDLRGGRNSKSDADRDLEFWGLPAVVRDSVSILRGGRQ
jgi:hypothetical protein